MFISFHSTSAAIRAEQTLLAKGFHVVVRPTPPEVKAGCGISLLIEHDDWDRVKAILDSLNIEVLVTDEEKEKCR